MPDLTVRLSQIVLDIAPVTEAQVCNAALALNGSKTIRTLEDVSDQAVACAAIYPGVRDAVLRAYPWNCAMQYATLSVDAAAPTWGYSYRFPLPTSPWCLRVLAMDNPEYVFKVAGRYLLTNNVSDNANIRFTCRVADPTEWDSLLKETVVARLAASLAVSLAGDKALAKIQWELYLQKLREARSVDGQEGIPDSFVSNDLTSVR